ncbi:type II toxin-antitoxin system VapB family antitoxin [Streptomyces sp. NPDC020298]|uniref:type II toxin-antitoxin system VapB family antitoxin n=1 Tax=unclassified Streptomyces TaxID=2593676 RepID=UPI0033F3133A
MSETTIDLDDDALEEALRVTGGGTKEDLINAALREYTERHERAALVTKYFRAAQQWDYSGWQRHRAEGKQGDA